MRKTENIYAFFELGRELDESQLELWYLLSCPVNAGPTGIQRNICALNSSHIEGECFHEDVSYRCPYIFFIFDRLSE